MQCPRWSQSENSLRRGSCERGEWKGALLSMLKTLVQLATPQKNKNRLTGLQGRPPNNLGGEIPALENSGGMNAEWPLQSFPPSWKFHQNWGSRRGHSTPQDLGIRAPPQIADRRSPGRPSVPGGLCPPDTLPGPGPAAAPAPTSCSSRTCSHPHPTLPQLQD